MVLEATSSREGTVNSSTHIDILNGNFSAMETLYFDVFLLKQGSASLTLQDEL